MYRLSITKEQLSKLDIVTFPGQVYVIDSLSKLNPAIAALRKYKEVGFDTETRPSFKKGVTHKPALMQISTPSECFLFRLNKIEIPEKLKDFIEDENVKKIGLSLKDDFNVLSRMSDVQPDGFIDLQQLVPSYGIIDSSLQKIYAIIFGEKISKSQRLSNWEAPDLSYGQKVYASIDAWACLKIYHHLMGNLFEPKDSPYQATEDSVQ